VKPIRPHNIDLIYLLQKEPITNTWNQKKIWKICNPFSWF